MPQAFWVAALEYVGASAVTAAAAGSVLSYVVMFAVPAKLGDYQHRRVRARAVRAAK